MAQTPNRSVPLGDESISQATSNHIVVQQGGQTVSATSCEIMSENGSGQNVGLVIGGEENATDNEIRPSSHPGIVVVEVAKVAPGYPRLAAILNNDDGFRFYRRFGTLHNRVLLRRQHELFELENGLLKMDQSDAQNCPQRLWTAHEDGEDMDPERRSLLDKIEEKLKAYDDLLYREQRSQAMRRPRRRNFHALINYLWDTRSPIDTSEVTPLRQYDDLVVLAEDEDPFFHVLLEKLLISFAGNNPFENKLRHLISGRDQISNAGEPFVWLISRHRINRLMKVIVTLLVLAFLIIPCCIFALATLRPRLGIFIICICVVLLPISLSLFSRAKNHELFAATIGYFALLITFYASFQPLR